MIPMQNAVYAVLTKQEAATNGATLTSDQLDCLGCDAVTFIVHATTSNNATNKPSVLKLQEADTTDATNFADVTAFVGGGTGGFTIPSAPTSTTTAPYAIWNVDTRYRKRYLRALVSPVTTQTFSIIAVKPAHRLEQVATSTTTINAAVVVNG